MASVIKSCFSWMRCVWLVLAILFAGCLKRSGPDTHSIPDIDSGIPSPPRVSADWTNYVALLRACDDGASVPHQVTATRILAVVSPDLRSSAASPLLASDIDSSLPQVYVLGGLVVSNLFNVSDHAPKDFSTMVDVFAWIVRGLRKEPFATSWHCAIVLEEHLLKERKWRTDDQEQQIAALVRTLGQAHVSNTIDFVEMNVACLKGVRLYGKHDDAADKTIPGILRTLETMRGYLKNHGRLKEQTLGLCAMVRSRHASAKKDMLVAYLDLLLAEIVLDEQKEATLRIK